MSRIAIFISLITTVVGLLGGFQWALNEWRLWRSQVKRNGKWLMMLGLLVSPSLADAACTGSSPAWSSTSDNASVASCISSATSGDTITVSGSGSTAWTWTSTKALKIIGPGAGSLTITSGFSYSPTQAEAVKTFEMSGFTFSGNAVFDAVAPDGTHPITGLKIHDNTFTGATTRAIALDGLEFGVFYSNTFSSNEISVSIIGAGSNGEAYAHAFGSANYPYFEDNTFGNGTGSFVYETGQGGRIAFRRNTVDSYNCAGCEYFDMHGDQGSGGTTISSENYHNTITNATANNRWVHHRGGQSVIFNNVSNKNIEFNFTEYRAWGGNSLCNPYPAVGQINNTFYFNNVLAGSNRNPTYTDESSGTGCGNAKPDGIHEASGFVVLNQDYWLPSSGTAAALPGTCTVDTYYGTTDTDTIYKCTSTNVWTVYYTPYTYPHPLRGVAQETNDGLRAIVSMRMMQWFEIVLPILGLGWHFKRQIFSVSIACIGLCSTVSTLTWQASQTMTKDATVKVLVALNERMKR